MFLIPDQKELKERRKAAGFSMKKLSQQAGLPDNAVLRIETGKTKRVNTGRTVLCNRHLISLYQ